MTDQTNNDFSCNYILILIFDRHLLKILFAYELQRTNAMPFTWNGDFSRESVLILAQVTAFAICKALTKMLNKIKTTNKTTKTKNKPTLQKNIVIKASATSYHCFLLQHAVQGKLTGADTALARW